MTARVVRARARSYLVSPEALGRLGDHVPQGEGESTTHRLLSMVSRVIRDVGVLRSRAAVDEGAETLAIQTDLNFPTPQARQAFARDLSHMVGELTSRYCASEGGDGQETFRLTIGGYDVE